MRQAIHTTFALILISCYLLLPATTFAHGNPLPDDTGASVSAKVATNGSPCHECPCSGTQETDCCDSDCCCPCHAPLTRHIGITYSPFVSYLYYPESHPAPTQVYLSIFVPPQNFSV